MRTDSVTIDVRATPEEIFDLLHDYSRRLEWDPFLREARLLDDATAADIGVVARCVARRMGGGLAMDTVYVSFSHPRVAAVRMTAGPWFFRSFAASIRQERIDDATTCVTYRYHFQLRPRPLAALLELVAGWVFRRETRGRLRALKRFLEGRRATVEA